MGRPARRLGRRRRRAQRMQEVRQWLEHYAAGSHQSDGLALFTGNLLERPQETLSALHFAVQTNEEATEIYSLFSWEIFDQIVLLADAISESDIVSAALQRTASLVRPRELMLMIIDKLYQCTDPGQFSVLLYAAQLLLLRDKSCLTLHKILQLLIERLAYVLGVTAEDETRLSDVRRMWKNLLNFAAGSLSRSSTWHPAQTAETLYSAMAAPVRGLWLGFLSAAVEAAFGQADVLGADQGRAIAAKFVSLAVVACDCNPLFAIRHLQRERFRVRGASATASSLTLQALDALRLVPVAHPSPGTPFPWSQLRPEVVARVNAAAIAPAQREGALLAVDFERQGRVVQVREGAFAAAETEEACMPVELPWSPLALAAVLVAGLHEYALPLSASIRDEMLFVGSLVLWSASAQYPAVAPLALHAFCSIGDFSTVRSLPREILFSDKCAQLDWACARRIPDWQAVAAACCSDTHFVCETLINAMAQCPDQQQRSVAFECLRQFFMHSVGNQSSQLLLASILARKTAPSIRGIVVDIYRSCCQQAARTFAVAEPGRLVAETLRRVAEGPPQLPGPLPALGVEELRSAMLVDTEAGVSALTSWTSVHAFLLPQLEEVAAYPSSQVADNMDYVLALVSTAYFHAQHLAPAFHAAADLPADGGGVGGTMRQWCLAWSHLAPARRPDHALVGWRQVLAALERLRGASPLGGDASDLRPALLVMRLDDAVQALQVLCAALGQLLRR